MTLAPDRNTRQHKGADSKRDNDRKFDHVISFPVISQSVHADRAPIDAAGAIVPRVLAAFFLSAFADTRPADAATSAGALPPIVPAALSFSDDVDPGSRGFDFLRPADPGAAPASPGHFKFQSSKGVKQCGFHMHGFRWELFPNRNGRTNDRSPIFGLASQSSWEAAMPNVAEATTMLRELAKPMSYGEPIKLVIERTSRLARISYWRTYDLWYGKARRVEDYEYQQIKTALRIKQESAARNELHDLKLRLARLEALLATKDADFHRLDIDFAREVLDGPGGSGRPVAPRGKRR
jgi:hypothetical protein